MTETLNRTSRVTHDDGSGYSIIDNLPGYLLIRTFGADDTPVNALMVEGGIMSYWLPGDGSWVADGDHRYKTLRPCTGKEYHQGHRD